MDSATTRLIGREDEQARLSAFMEAATGQALVVRGEAGVGKSALLDHTADLARQSGHLVIRATGVEAESELPYAGLHQLLHPLLSGAVLPGYGCRTVFNAAFAQHEGTPPSVMALGVATLGLVTRAAAEQPLLLVLDDGQWLDEPSADVCGFVSRRIAGSPVKLLVAVRADVASHIDMGALPEVAVGALSDDDAARLLDHHHPALRKHARQVVLDQAQGNPLALLELLAHVAGWAERARAEFQVTRAASHVSTLSLPSLTWQERRIADLAAGGLTNKEIGRRMHLSPRTVSSHLYRIFPKLGITTRAALRDALSRTDEVTSSA
ncbi:helix-turn-helix transcriptional regulator [Microbispora sp. NEAU-D428]|uniref:helix-turn-helix domain-containing protein n=1 Tax=Microbispora sitophila TaxID=2771537 RepID=UPI00186861FE|nr:AAA family ATPase [Microbispora sitophila]MBE3012105.1 helix-turn-helix transcriptional regulator [Microbispora sitophila]